MRHFVLSFKKVMLSYYLPQYLSKHRFTVFSHRKSKHITDIPEPDLDLEYLCNPKNKDEIQRNVKNRKGVGDINRVHELHHQLQNETLNSKEKDSVLKELKYEANMIPNKSYSALDEYWHADTPKVLSTSNNKRNFSFDPKEFSDITKDFNWLRTEHLGHFTGQRSYYFMNELADMEQALVHFSLQNLLDRDFQLISVPNILPRHVIESCGLNTKGNRTQVYELEPELYGEDLCLSGTSEMALAGYLMNAVFPSHELPQRLAAVSRCYRAETSSIAEERGVYRVHQFTKVEMFAVTDRECSNNLLEEFRAIQEQSFVSLGLHIQTLDMPPHELGAPAYRKYDVEAWLPGRKCFGELSSCSNCTDYQSRRLNIKYQLNDVENTRHVHTVNGTACAVPRMLIALLETHQQADGTVLVPEPLQQYMGGKTRIGKQKGVPQMKYIKSKYREKKHTLDRE